ncbi:hypothetical protein O181_105339 [Austropuccinia psidii MF-1]|uniref:Uncharacterized protein n=1 Tax=Austropuccinia psidii MF-1 TaxID=1389203 RepID=A0A9Q3PL06_9BASI|nr:hypothetical protein [Austropuccinia psidii MF-1]
MTEGQRLVNEAQTEKTSHSEVNNTFLLPNRSERATRSLSGHKQIQPEGLEQCLADVEKLSELLSDCENVSGPSQDLNITQWIEYIDGKQMKASFKQQNTGKTTHHHPTKWQKQPQYAAVAIMT